MSCNSSLPPPICDSSGKIYIAIPAPSFVLAQDASAQSHNVNNAPGYVYVEYNSNVPYGLPHGSHSSGRDDSTEVKPSASIKNWMISHCIAEPPPGHIPWTGAVPPSPSSSASISISADGGGLPNKSLASSTLANSSVYSFEIPSLNSDDTLLDGSLPSTCSSAWSNGFVPPPIVKAKTATDFSKPASSYPPVTEKQRSSVKCLKAPDKRRYTMCVPTAPNRRDALVFNRRRTLDKTQHVHPIDHKEAARILVSNRIMSQINDLDDFFSDGLRKMDLTMLTLHDKQDKVETPSLVVSTSSAICTVSLESCDDFKVSLPPLAQRRGKNVPVALKIDGRASSAFDYPDIPTAFRGSPEATSQLFGGVPKYPTIKIDSKMTTEQMICSLREQVESFYPLHRESGMATDAFRTHCMEAEVWLETELERNPGHPSGQATELKQLSNETESLRDDESSHLPLMFPRPPPQVEDNNHARTPHVVPCSPIGRVKSLQARVIRLPTSNLKSWNSKACTPKPKPRKSILSVGSVSSHGSTKKVRFSDVPPSVITPLKGVVRDIPTSVIPTRQTPKLSPKRKPVPPVSSIKPPIAMRSSLPSTPMKTSVVRRSSPLNPAVQSAAKSTPISRPALKRSVDPMPLPEPSDEKRSTPVLRPRIGTPLRKGPLIFSSAPNTPISKECVDKSISPKKSARPVSLGANLKENRDRSLTNKLATLAKRRSYAGGRNDADKENQRDSKLAGLVAREVQKKGGRRSLPFQNMLSRLRG